MTSIISNQLVKLKYSTVLRMIYNQNEMINNQHKRRVITICLKQTLNLDYLYNTFERNDYLEM